MCAHNASGHGWLSGHTYTIIYIVTNIQACTSQYIFHHLTYLNEARFAHQLEIIVIYSLCASIV